MAEEAQGQESGAEAAVAAVDPCALALALTKFAEAEKYAPNPGRLHLKWGEALYYAGRRDDAKKQFARAAQLDLSPSEKSELARVNHV